MCYIEDKEDINYNSKIHIFIQKGQKSLLITNITDKYKQQGISISAVAYISITKHISIVKYCSKLFFLNLNLKLRKIF